MQTETEGLTLLCKCGKELKESAMFEFGGNVACEKCVRDYYRDFYLSLPEFFRADVKKFIEDELQVRRRGAVTLVRCHRRQFAKQATKMALPKTQLADRGRG